MTNSASTAGPLSADTGEICVICGKDAGSGAFCHYFVDGHRLVLCSPACAERFLRENGDVAAPQQARVAQRQAIRDYDRNPPAWE